MTGTRKVLDPYLWALLGILFLNALLKWHFFSGLTQADDFSYGVYSFSFFKLPLPWDLTMDFRALRLAMLLPVALLFRILPPTEFVAVLWPMTASFGIIVLVFLIGRKLHGPLAGIIAAFIMATLPGDVIYGTMLLPDVLAPFFMVLAVWCFLNAESGAGRSPLWWYLAAGTAVFLALDTRENSYYFLLFFLPFAFSAMRWKRGLYMVGVGFAVPLTLLYAFYAFKSGDFLFNLHLAANQRDPLIQSGYIPPNSRNWFMSLFYMFPGFFRGLTGQDQWASNLFGLTFYAGTPCVLYAAVKGWIKKDRRLLLAPWWFLLGYLFIEYGTISFSSYHMMLKLPRFLLTITPPMALACGVALADAFGRTGKTAPVTPEKPLRKGTAATKRAGTDIRWLTAPFAAIIFAAILFTSWGAMKYQHDSLNFNMSQFRWAYNDVLKNRPRLPIYGTGGWWDNKLSFYMLPDIRYATMPWRKSNMLRDLKAAQNPAELGGSYIIMDRTNFSGQNDLRIRHSYDEFGPWALLPPKEWKLLGAQNGTEIYEVPAGWTYTAPSPEELASGSLLHAVKVDDYVLFLYNLHPEFVKTLTKEQFWGLFGLLKDERDPGRADMLAKRLMYRDDNGKMKIEFNFY